MHFTKSVIFACCARAGDVKKSGSRHCAFFQNSAEEPPEKPATPACPKAFGEPEGGRTHPTFQAHTAACARGQGAFCGEKSHFQSKNRPERQRRGARSPLRRLINAFLDKLGAPRRREAPQTVKKTLENSKGTNPPDFSSAYGGVRAGGRTLFAAKNLISRAKTGRGGSGEGSALPCAGLLMPF